MKKICISLLICLMLSVNVPVYAKKGISATHKSVFVGSRFTLSLKSGKVKKASASKKIVSLKRIGKKKVRVKGKKAGQTVVTIKSGKRKYRCHVKVNNYVHVKVIGIHKTFFNRKVALKKGDTVFDVLKRTHLSYKKKGFGPMIYVSSIHGLAEKTHGPLSGWMYSVNGKEPNFGANAYHLKAKQKVKWFYVNY